MPNQDNGQKYSYLQLFKKKKKLNFKNKTPSHDWENGEFLFKLKSIQKF